MNKTSGNPCCGGHGHIYAGIVWSCAECGKIDLSMNKAFGVSTPFNPEDLQIGFTPKCECGAEKTSNPNLHARWCPKYGSK